MSQIDKWKEARRPGKWRRGKKNPDHAQLHDAPTLPKSSTVHDLRVEGDIDLSIFDDLQPDQDFMIMPTAPTEGHVYTVSVDETSGEQVVAATDPTTITTAPPITSAIASDNGTPSFAVDPGTRGGPGWLKVQWLAAIGTSDSVYYNVFVDTDPGMTPNFGTNYVGATYALEMVIGTDFAGNPLETAGEYYVVVSPVSALSGLTSDSNVVGPVSPDGIDANVTTFSNVDAATITVGLIDVSQLNVTDVMASTINSIMVDTDTLIAGDAEGNRVQIDENGLRLFNALGEVITFPTDGSAAIIRGTLIADELSVINGATIQGSENVLDESGVLTLVDVQGNPAIAPTVTPGQLETLQLTGSTTAINGTSGLFYDSTNSSYWRMTGRSSSGNIYVEEFDASTGVFIRSVNVSASVAPQLFISGGGGIVRLGSSVWIVVPGTDFSSIDGLQLIQIRETDLLVLNRHNLQSLMTRNEGNSLGIDDSGTYLVVGDWTSASGSGQPKLHYIDPSTPTTISSTLTCSGGTAATPSEAQMVGLVNQNNFWWVAYKRRDGSRDFVDAFDDTTGGHQSDAKFYPDNLSANKLCGLTYDGTNFWSFRNPNTEEPLIHKHTNFEELLAVDHLWFGYRWDDGSFHTQLSPLVGVPISSYRRTRFSITVPTPPSGMVTQIFAYKSTSSTPAATSLLRQAATTYISTESGTSIYMKAYNSGGAAASPNSNTFGAGDSSIIATASGFTTPWELTGSGQIAPTVATLDQRATMGSPKEGSILAMHDSRTLEVYDGSANWWPAPIGAIPYFFWLYEDFTFSNPASGDDVGTGGLEVNTGSAGATPPDISMQDVAGHPGVAQFSTGNGASATIRMLTTSTLIRATDGRIRFSVNMKANNKPTSAQNFVAYAGLNGSGSADPTGAALNQIEIVVSRTDDTTMLVQGRVNDAGTVQTVTIQASEDTNFHTYGFQVNAAGTSVQFYRDYAAVGSPITTHIPTVGMCERVGIIKTNGTTTRAIQVDYLALWQALTTKR